jgi:hypothetical protein
LQAEFPKNIRDDQVVPSARPGHGEDFAGIILAFALRLALQG